MKRKTQLIWQALLPAALVLNILMTIGCGNKPGNSISNELVKTSNTSNQNINSGNQSTGGTVDITANPVELPVFKNAVGMEFVKIPAGKFLMGSNEDEDTRVHEVTLTKDFWLGKTEVTQKQWKAVMGNFQFNCKAPKGMEKDLEEVKAKIAGDNKPAVCVSWNDVQEFIKKLNTKGDGSRYRLPTEAEWDYAQRTGLNGNTVSNLDQVAWHGGNSADEKGWRVPREAASKQPNRWGLYDMLGNVEEWTSDYSAEYQAAAVTDPTGPPTSPSGYRVVRGGDYTGSKDSKAMKLFYRTTNGADFRDINLGFRVAKDK